MARKIGKIILALFVTSFLWCSDKSIQLELLDSNGNHIVEAGKEVPFLLKVTVTNVDSSDAIDTIPGFENFEFAQSGSNVVRHITNGQVKHVRSFLFSLQSEKEGLFEVGPLKLQEPNGTVVQSKKISIKVSDELVVDQKQRDDYSLDVVPSDKHVYKGQILTLSVRFYYASNYEQLQILDPKLEGFVVQDIVHDAKEYSEKIGDKEYNYKQILIKVYPEKSGHIKIPSIQGAYSVPDAVQNFFGMASFLGMKMQHRVDSAQRVIHVDPLPHSDEFDRVTAVGDFKQALFALNKKSGEVGEGIIATLQIIGNGNMEMISSPELHLPDGLRYYSSNSSVEKIHDEFYSKNFEYVLQADQADDFKIDSQGFVYFDLQKKKYKQLKTDGASLGIIPAPELKTERRSDLSEESHKESVFVFGDDQISFIYTDYLEGQSTRASFYALIMLCFYLLIALLLLLVIGLLFYGFGAKNFWIKHLLYYCYVRYKLFFTLRSQKPEQLYILFQSVAMRYQFDLQGDLIVSCLKTRNSSREYVSDWQKYSAMLSAFIFSGDNKSPQVKKELLDKGSFWLKELLACAPSLQKK